MSEVKGYVDQSENFDEFLAADGLLEETEAAAYKQVASDCEEATKANRTGK